ncbi:MAG: hypothetical protein JWR50_2733 [Mucilaginibacter sp.]|nr:hypothetical protein [Mucilaginibacter sp.]
MLNEQERKISKKYYLYHMRRKSTLEYLFVTLIISSLIVSSAYRYQAGKVIQINVDDLLNVRPVTTLTNGKLVVWDKGVDRENGYLTMAAGLFNKETESKAIPDDPLIPADQHHPAILLHYANKEGVKNQAKLLSDTNSFTIKVPKHNYSDLYLCLTSAYGTSNLEYSLIYADGAEVKHITVPDWANDVPNNDPDFSYVIHDRAKWSNKNTLTETEHHNIHALNVHPDIKRILTAVKVKNLSKTYMLFWAATGVVK